jgi:LysM repeat protein
MTAAAGVVVIAGLAWVVSSDQTTALKANEIALTERREDAKDAAILSPAVPATPDAVLLAGVEPASPVTEPVAAAPTTTQPSVERVHVAQAGDTLSGIAADLPGNQGHAYQAAIIHANPSLRANPDRLVTGQSYVIPASPDVVDAVPAKAPASPVVADVLPTEKASIKPPVSKAPATELRYTARAGDTLIAMAEAFLGSGSRVNQDAIIAANASLDADPDQVVAGRTYRIPAPDGLSASPTSSSDHAAVRPAVQPDADQLVAAGAPRSLRYTARAGDTVTTLAIELLGSDTADARNAIINHNPALKAQPDRVVAGQIYSIPAPAATP